MQACSFIDVLLLLGTIVKTIRTHMSKCINPLNTDPLEHYLFFKKRNDHEDQLTGKVLHLYLLSNFLNNILVIRIGTILIILECIKMHDI